MELKDDATVRKEVVQAFLKGREEAEQLINKGIDMNIIDSYSSVVEHAVKQGNSDLVQFLLDNGAKYTEYGVLSAASTSGQEDLVILLLERFNSAERRQDNEDHERALDCCLFHVADEPDKFKNIEQILNYAGNLADRGYYYHHPLLAACERGNENLVRLLVDRGADLFCRDADDIGNALHWATRSKNSNLVEWLLDQGFNVNEKDKSGDNALSSAVHENNTKVVEVLLKHGAKFNTLDCENLNDLLISTCGNGNESMAKLLIECGADINSKYENGHYTPLETATKNGHANIVKFLLESGANVTTLTRCGKENLLHLAVETTKIELVELFLQRGLKVSSKTEYGDTALSRACCHGNTEIIKLLLEYATDMGEDMYLFALKRAFDRRQENVVKFLLESATFYDINLRDVKQLEDFIHSAAIWGKKSIVQILLDRGVDVNCKSKCGRSVLYHALYSKDIDTINLVLKKVTNIEEDALLASVKSGFNRFTEKLLKQGLNINWRMNEQDFSALESSLDNFNHFQTLWNYGGNVNAQGHRNVPLLNLACFTGNMDVVKFLLDKGADTTATDANGINCLISAVDGGHLEIVKMLLERGMDVEFRDSFGRNALSTALIGSKKKYKYSVNDLKDRFYCRDEAEYVNILEFLLDYGARLDIKNQNDCENFVYVCKNTSDHSKLKLLLAYNLDINFVNEQWTGLIDYLSNWSGAGRIVTQCVVKARSKFVYVMEKVLLDINEIDYLRAHRIKCEKEIKLMKKKMIGNSRISFYNILASTDSNQLVEYASNVDVLKAFSVHYKVALESKAMFPIYYDEMRYQIKKGIWRNYLLSKIVATNETPLRKLSTSNRELQAQNGVGNANCDIHEVNVNYEY